MELNRIHFGVEKSTTLTKTTQETAFKYQIPEDIALKYAQVLADYKKSQSYLELAIIIRVFTQKIKSDRKDIMKFIPHMTWLLMKSREWNKEQRVQPKEATEYMKEYLKHY